MNGSGCLPPTLIQDVPERTAWATGEVPPETAWVSWGEESFLGTRSHDVAENTMKAETMRLESHDVYENRDVRSS